MLRGVRLVTNRIKLSNFTLIRFANYLKIFSFLNRLLA